MAPASVSDALKAVKREDYPDSYAYSEAMLKASEAAQEAGVPLEEPVNEIPPTGDLPAEAVDPAAAPVVEEPKTEEAKPAEGEVKPEDEFQMDEPESLAPEALNSLLGENEKLREFVEADPTLKGRLFKTARLAAAAEQYREVFPDIESAKLASETASTFSDIRTTFMGSTTKEGTMATLSKMAELAVEVDDQGNPVLDAAGNKVIGQDFYDFVDNTVAIDIASKRDVVQKRLDANLYPSEEAREKDEQRLSAYDILMEENTPTSTATGDLPEHLKQKAKEIEQAHAKLNEQKTAAQLQAKQTFEASVRTDATKSLQTSIESIIASVERQGGVIAPFVRQVLPEKIGQKFVERMKSDKTLGAQLEKMARELPSTDAAKARRLARFQTAVETYLPSIAREILKEAGVQPAKSQDAKREKIAAQTAASRAEPKGSTGPAAPNQPMAAVAARDAATEMWRKAHPGRIPDRFAQEEILGIAVRLQTGQSV